MARNCARAAQPETIRHVCSGRLIETFLVKGRLSALALVAEPCCL
jgi:hypothetical protein